MKSVNLLPKWYLQERRQRRYLRVHAGVMLLLGAAMAGAGFVGQQRIAALGRQRNQLETRLSQVADPEATLKRKQTDLHRLEDLQLAYRELGKTIPMSSVIQQLQNDMTPGMALSQVSIEVRPDPVKGSGNVGDTHNPPKYHDVAYLTVEGIAPNDVQIAQLIKTLSTNPLLTDVMLDYTKTGALDAFLVRRFEIKTKMDLDRLTNEDPEAQSGKDPASVASGGLEHGE